MKKRLVSMALVLVMVLSLMVVPVSADTTTGTEGYLTYEIEDGEVTITGYYIDADDSNFNGELVIPDTIEGYPVTTIGNSAFYGCTDLTGISIPDSVTSIDNDAFSYCTSLTSITIPGSVTSIGIYAFENCTSLTSVTIGNGVTSIGYWAFSDCTSLTSITISDSVTSIGQCAFIRTGYYNDESNWENGILYLDCYLLVADADTLPETYAIKDGTTVIADEAFYNCTSLASITIPDSVTNIGESAFNGCTSLTGIDIPDSVTRIGGGAFCDCTSLTSITIPDGVTIIGGQTFFGCTSLTSITFEGNAPTIGEGAFYNVTATAYYPADNDTWTEDVMQDYGGTITWVAYSEETEPATSGQCGDNAYWSFDAETGTLTISGTGDMYNIEWATEVTETYTNSYPDQPWYDYAVEITAVIIGDGITSIGDYEFAYLGELTSVMIGSNVTSIGYYAFGFCTSLSSVTIPGNVKTIGDFAFDGCDNLSVTLEEGIETIGNYAFRYNYGTTDLVIPDSVTAIGESAFYWTSLESVTIGNGVTNIGRYAFGRNYYLTEVWFTGDAPVIGEDAFDSYYNQGDERNVVITAYYPADNDTWTEDVMQDYGGTITWVAYEVEPTDPEPTEENPFTDVNTGHYFYSAVLWAVDNGITSGTSETTFSPFLTAERCQVVTFLWRAAGCPEVAEGTENPFTDVNEGDYFYTAVLWAVEQGITTGTSDTTFSPYATCERCQVVTFLYRYAGNPEVTTSENPFTDVDTDDYFYSAVLWAVENSITTGTSDTTFGPFVTCERCMVVTFLYRALVE